MSHAANGPQAGPTPERFFNAINGYQQGAVLQAALELNFFTAIAQGHNTAAKAAAQCGVAERGARILADRLTIMGFLTKEGMSYRLAEDAAMFLNRGSPAYLGGCVEFLLSPHIKGNFEALTERVRHGGAPAEGAGGAEGVLAPNNEVWVHFARGMAGLMMMPSQMLARHLLGGGGSGGGGGGPRAMKVLDIAAGHGLFGIAVAQQNPEAQVTGLDWENVLAVAREHAGKFGVAGRYHTIAGSAFEVDLGRDYDLVLVPNFLHHFDRGTNSAFLKRVHGALKPGGRVAVLEFAPNEDRVTPAQSAGFALMMLAGTPAGDAYTVKELEGMLEASGFKEVAWGDLAMTMQRVMVGRK